MSEQAPHAPMPQQAQAVFPLNTPTSSSAPPDSPGSPSGLSSAARKPALRAMLTHASERLNRPRSRAASQEELQQSKTASAPHLSQIVANISHAQTRVQPAIRMKELPMNKVIKQEVADEKPPEETLEPKPQPLAAQPQAESVAAGKQADLAEEKTSRVARLKMMLLLWVGFPFVIAVVGVMLGVCLGIDRAMQDWMLDGSVPTEYDYSLSAFVYTIMNPNPDQARGVMDAVTNTMAFMFGLLVTVIGIVLQFASDKITSHVTSLFFKSRVILGALAYVLVSNAFALWVDQECGPFHSPRIAVLLSVVMVDLQVVMLFPFLAYLFYFLDAEQVITNIARHGLDAVVNSITSRGPNNERNQVNATLAVEYLMDGALSSIKKKNKNITSEIIDAMCDFLVHYAALKDKTPDVWFQIPLWIRQSPDFLILNDEGVKEMVERKTWLEWKVLRQYQNLFVEAIKFFKEMCYHICINTRLIGETAAGHNQLHSIDLCIKFFNTYLRTAINLVDVRVVYNTLFQYRLLAELLIDRSRGASKDLALRSLKIAKFCRYYAHLCQQRNLFFLVETVAQDLRILCQVAIKSAVPEDKRSAGRAGFNPNRAIFQQVHDKLLSILLSINDFTGTTDARRGVIRAQAILGIYYLTEKQVGQARRIIKVLDRDDYKDLLMSIKEEMSMSTTREFWEVSERGANFTYMEPRLRQNLDAFFGMFAWFAQMQTSDAWAAFQKSAGGKQLRVQQELQNFEAEMPDEDEDDGGEFDSDLAQASEADQQ
eukprot:m51a1_g1841 hypothetical protein (768) ;mRNA; f:565696-568463